MRSRTVTTKLFFNLSIRLNNYGRGKNKIKKKKYIKKQIDKEKFYNKKLYKKIYK